MKNQSLLLSIGMGLIFFSACTSSSSDDLDLVGKTPEQTKLIMRGKTIYSAVCTSCHGLNPKVDGSLGPAIAGSSLELLESRVLFAKYPEGYKPKRDTHAMLALPQFKSEIPALHAYLNALK
ncbi:MAG: cytochrome c [Deltaproteobacteria bacterium]|nr:cytochrome c [Deltaproteobacteria bacterium]